jgi:tungstate transport system substrate-binding protein
MNNSRWWRVARGGGALICALLQACTSEPPIRIGTTFTVQQSGALALLDSMTDSAPARFAVVIGPSGQVLRAASEGNLDLVLAHAPALERRFLDGRWTRRCPFATSHFAIVGPKADPAHVAQAPSIVDAMRGIASRGAMFVSRGDSSGTHEKELALWKAAGLARERGDTYFETGGDQASTLRLADEWGAYALADLPTFARQQDLTLAVLFVRDSLLGNPYTLYVLRPDSAGPGGPGVRDSLAAWLLSAWRRRVVALRLRDSTPAFSIDASSCEATRPR